MPLPSYTESREYVYLGAGALLYPSKVAVSTEDYTFLGVGSSQQSTTALIGESSQRQPYPRLPRLGYGL